MEGIIFNVIIRLFANERIKKSVVLGRWSAVLDVSHIGVIGPHW